MDRRTLLKSLGASATIVGSGTIPAAANREGGSLSEEEAEERLQRAAKKDAKQRRRVNSLRGVGTTRLVPADENSNVRQVLMELDPKTRAAVLEDKLSFESRFGSRADSSTETQLSTTGTTGETSNFGTSILYYDFGITKSWVAKWHQEIDYGWDDNDKLTYAEARYWGEISTGGKIDQWTQKWSKKAEESGGEGESRYRLFTKAQYAMCFGFYPVQSCTNHTTLWVDMTVKPGYGNDDVETR